MVRRVSVLIAALLLGPAVGWADDVVSCPPGTRLRKIGSVASANDTGSVDHTISTTGHAVRASVITCNSTACAGTLYDTDGGANGATNAVGDVLLEPGCVASASCWQTYDPPVQFDQGITYHEGSNILGLILYECR